MTFDLLSDLNLPEKCNGCAVQCDNVAQLAGLMIHKEMGNKIGESVMDEDFETFLGESLPSDVADEALVHLRQSIGEGLDDIDDRIEEIKDIISADSLACDGVLKMRAAKGDVLYTVSVCTSQRRYTRDSSIPEHLPVHINARSNNLN